MKKRVFSFLLVVALLCTMLPQITFEAKAAESSWLWPAPNCYIISSNFGWRDYAPSPYHMGIDIIGASGTAGKPVVASKSGTVYSYCNSFGDEEKYSGSDMRSYGNYVMIKHDDGKYTIYAHLKKSGVKTSGTVKQGDVIGYIGNSGSSSDWHLHFQIFTNPSNLSSSSLNPMPTNSNITINNEYVLPSGWASQKQTYIFSLQNTISFSNTGDTSMSSITVNAGSSVTLPTTVPHKFGENFYGWICNGTTYQPGQTFTPTGNMTLSGDWREYQGTVVENLNFSENIKYPGVGNYTTIQVEETGYYTLSGASYVLEDLLENGIITYIDNVGYLYNSAGTLLASNDDGGNNHQFKITYYLYADTDYIVYVKPFSSSIDAGVLGWGISRTKYTVDFDGDGGTPVPDSITVYKGESITIPSTIPEKYWANFQGWVHNSIVYQPGSDFVATKDSTLAALWGTRQITQTGTYEHTSNYPGVGVKFTFVVDQAGKYQFRGLNEKNLDTKAYLYDANGNQIAYNDDGDGTDTRQFLIQEYLEPGTYYVWIKPYFSSITGTLKWEIGRINGTDGNINWEISGKTLTISGSGAMPDYTYDSSSDSYMRPWEQYIEFIESVVVSDGITGVGKYAFYKITNLESVTFGCGVTTIGSYAFGHCTSLTNITIPEGVTFIGGGAFYGCTSLENITIPNSVSTMNSYVFKGCTSLTEVTIPNNMTDIWYYSFDGCTNLTVVTIPSSVVNIAQGAFNNCTSLTDVYYSGSQSQWDAITIGANNDPLTKATLHCNGYWYLTYKISNGEVTITDCDTSVTGSITIPATLDGYPVTAIGDGAFRYCDGLTGVIIPDSVTTIGEDAFYQCDSLTSITVPDSVTSIGTGAFRYCDNLTGILVDESNNNYSSDSYGVLFDKDKTELIQAPMGGSFGDYTVPKSVTVVDTEAFYKCMGLTGVTFGNNVATIEQYAFYGCTGLTKITVPSSVTAIDYYAFYNCTNLADIYYYGTNEQWNAIMVGTNNECLTNATLHCNEYWYLTYEINDGEVTITECDRSVTGKIVLPAILDGYPVTAIKGAFWLCTGLTEVIIPDSVTAIGSNTFLGCSNLQNVTIGNNVTIIGNSAFEGCSNLKNITIPDSVTTIGRFAFSQCKGLQKVSIGNGVTTIDMRAFIGCSSLTEITIPASVTSLGLYTFRDCSSLTDIWVEKNNTAYSSDGNGVLFDKNKTTLIQAPGGISGSYTIPSGVSSISVCAFENCENLQSVTIPTSVTQIDANAFLGCSVLTDIYYNGTEAQWAQISVGANNDSLTNATLHCHAHSYAEDPSTCGTCGHVRVSAEITSVVFRPSAAGIYFKGEFAVDAQTQVVRQGVVVSTSNALPVADDSDETSLYTTSGTSVLISGVLKDTNKDGQNAQKAMAPIYARTYVLLEDGTYIYGDVVTVNLRQIVQGIDAKWNSLGSAQKSAILAMYEAYAGVMQFWEIPNMKEDLV